MFGLNVCFSCLIVFRFSVVVFMYMCFDCCFMFISVYSLSLYFCICILIVFLLFVFFVFDCLCYFCICFVGGPTIVGTARDPLNKMIRRNIHR